MKKRWIYTAIALALIVAVVFIVVNRNVPKDSEISQDGPEEDVEDMEDEEVDEDGDGEKDIDEEEEISDEGGPQSERPDTEDSEDIDFGDQEIEIGKKLPDFQLENLEGERVRLRDLEDKIVLINFWATWCPYCVEEMPDLQRLKEENDDLKIIAVNVNETKEEAQTYIEEGGYDFEVLLDPEGEVAMQYQAFNLPISYFVDKDGIFLGNHPGMMTYEQMDGVLEQIREMQD